MKIRIRESEGCDEQPFLLWDTVWHNELSAYGGYGDWAVKNGALQSENALHTAAIIILGTDARAPDDLPVDDDDQRGWWGNDIVFEDEPDQDIGTLFWTLERGVLNLQTELLAQDYLSAGFQVLVDQGAVAEVAVTTSRDEQRGVLSAQIVMYGQKGNKMYDQKFDFLWETQH